MSLWDTALHSHLKTCTCMPKELPKKPLSALSWFYFLFLSGKTFTVFPFFRWRSENWYFLIMELVGGGELFDVIVRNKSLNEMEASNLAAGAPIWWVRFAHEAEVPNPMMLEVICLFEWCVFVLGGSCRTCGNSFIEFYWDRVIAGYSYGYTSAVL